MVNLVVVHTTRTISQSNAINRVQYKGDVTNSPEIDSFVTHNQLPLVVQYSVISARKVILIFTCQIKLKHIITLNWP